MSERYTMNDMQFPQTSTAKVGLYIDVENLSRSGGYGM